MAKFVYSPGYDFGLLGLEKLHPFDSSKYSKAWREFTSCAEIVEADWVQPSPLNDEILSLIHTDEYLDSLQQSKTIAQIAEVSLAGILPFSLLNKGLLSPVKLATSGTVTASTLAISESTIAMNFGGGYHHAFSDHGEGFSFFADAAIAISYLRNQKLVGNEDNIAVIDLDAHRGNGFEDIFKADLSVKNFDMYNFQTYPGGFHDDDGIDDSPFMIPLRAGTKGSDYLETLGEELPNFFDVNPLPVIAFYNAGTDILESDPLGGLKVSYNDVLERDRFVIGSLMERNIPTVVMTSGGYTRESYKLVAELAKTIYNLS